MKTLYIITAAGTIFIGVVAIMNVVADRYAPTHIPATVFQKTCTCRATVQDAYTRNLPLIKGERIAWKEINFFDETSIDECRCPNVPTTKGQMQLFSTSYTIDFVDKQQDKTYSYSFQDADRYRAFMEHRYWGLKVSHNGKVLDVYPLPEQ